MDRWWQLYHVLSNKWDVWSILLEVLGQLAHSDHARYSISTRRRGVSNLRLVIVKTFKLHGSLNLHLQTSWGIPRFMSRNRQGAHARSPRSSTQVNYLVKQTCTITWSQIRLWRVASLRRTFPQIAGTSIKQSTEVKDVRWEVRTGIFLCLHFARLAQYAWIPRIYIESLIETRKYPYSPETIGLSVPQLYLQKRRAEPCRIPMMSTSHINDGELA